LTPADFETVVVVQHWGAVYRLLRSLTGCAHESEDLTQETFLRALQHIDQYQPGSNLRAWLLRIASNAFFDLKRKHKRCRTGPLQTDLVCCSAPPGHALETAERTTLVLEVLAELSELTRLVFHLRAAENLPFRDIAALAGTTEQAARWHMRQARVKLLQRLGEEF
jgi:RNA polymerase sigma-70 factor (ECF subfamily)